MAFNFLRDIDISNQADTWYEGMEKSDLNFSDIDDELYPARGTASSLDARLDVSMNEDGTMKSSIAGRLWSASNMTPTYIGTSSYSVTGDQTATLVEGLRVQITLSGSTVYNTIASSAYTTLTTITLETANIDNTISDFSIGLTIAGTTGCLPKHSHTDLDQGGALFAVTDKTANYTLTADDLKGDNTFTNDAAAGAVNYTWPTLVSGQRARFDVTDAQYLRVTAPAGKKFRIFNQQSATAGYIRSNIVGSSMLCVANADDILVYPNVGAWYVDE